MYYIMKRFSLIGRMLLLCTVATTFTSCDNDDDIVFQPTEAEIMIQYLQKNRIQRVEIVCESMGFESTPNENSHSYEIDNPFIVIKYHSDFSCKFNLNDLIGYKDLGEYVILYFN